MSNYSIAISKHEETDFLLGKKEYLSPDNERYGKHQTHITFRHIKEYATEVGATEMLEKLMADIKRILMSSISAEEFSMITNYIFLCLRGYYEDGIFNAELTIDEEFKVLYRHELSELEEKVGQSISLGNIESTEYTDEFYLNNAKRFASMIKDKFGISLT